MPWSKLQMAVFPTLEVAFLAAAVPALSVNLPLTFTLVVLSAVSMNFTLHITVHYHVHHKPASRAVRLFLDYVYSILLAMPFHFYQTLHINHHIHDNAPEDFTSTWKRHGDRLVPRNVLIYSFFWLFRGQARTVVRKALEDGYLSARNARRIGREFVTVLSFGALLAIWRIELAALYASVFYLGWSLISLHNYGQHLPRSGSLELGNSYYGRLYNLLFVNNGLHYEHHSMPNVAYWDLESQSSENRPNVLPHTIDGIRFAVSELDAD